jgi:hypothetical protein
MTTTLPERGHHEVHFLKIAETGGGAALWIRFTLLASNNGFRRVAETWAVVFARGEQREVNKSALKQTHEITAFARLGAKPADGVRIGESTLGPTRTQGTIQSKGKTFKWDFEISPAQEATFQWVPDSLARLKITRMTGATLGEDLRFTGFCEMDGQRLEFNKAPGLQGYIAGPSFAHSWVRGHCNSFVNERGEPVYCIFDGLSVRARIGGLVPTPRFSPFYFFYRNKEYALNSFWDSIRSRSSHTLNGWKFQADCGDISFRGQIHAEHRDFAGVTYEDTDGSLLYGSNAELSDMTLWIYRRGKIETTLNARGSAAFEIVSRAKNPYVPLLL